MTNKHAQPSDFAIGDRVQLAPYLDLWMRGARYGNVVHVGRTKVHVCLDRVGPRPVPLCADDLALVGEG